MASCLETQAESLRSLTFCYTRIRGCFQVNILRLGVFQNGRAVQKFAITKRVRQPKKSSKPMVSPPLIFSFCGSSSQLEDAPISRQALRLGRKTTSLQCGCVWQPRRGWCRSGIVDALGSLQTWRSCCRCGSGSWVDMGSCPARVLL